MPQRTGALRAGLETYALETALGAQQDEAIAAAIMAGARVHETAVLYRICRAAEIVAASLLAEAGGRYSSHAAAITWFAGHHIFALPALTDVGQFQPAPGDVIEVTLTGTVLTADSSGTWTLADETTGCLYRFAAPGRNGAPSMHFLDRARHSGSHDPPPTWAS